MIWVTAFLVNAVLIGLAQRIPLLTPAGWVNAGILGTVLWGSLGWQGWSAVVAYLVLGSLVTKLGWAVKQQRGLEEGRGGRRGPENVWGSAAVGAGLALMVAGGLQPAKLLMVGFAASFAAKLADTFGSEIGQRWGRTTLLITTLQPVPAGTEGAISLEGTLASAVGSVVMSMVMLLFGLITTTSELLLISVVGLIATLAESLLGALAQHRINWLSNEAVNGIQTLFAALLAMALASGLHLA